MKKTLNDFRKEFILSDDLIADISEYGEVPIEIQDEDVYDYTLLFKNEDVAVNYICEHYKVSREQIIKDLHEEDSFREEYGKTNYMRSAHVEFTSYISELDDGTYILWEAF